MRSGIARIVALVLILMPVDGGAAVPSRCRLEVLSSAELPYAPIGDWLLKTRVRVTYPHGPAAILALASNSPWQATLRRGDAFWFDCERLQDVGTISLAR
jgi:hypothetical protein